MTFSLLTPSKTWDFSSRIESVVLYLDRRSISSGRVSMGSDFLRTVRTKSLHREITRYDCYKKSTSHQTPLNPTLKRISRLPYKTSGVVKGQSNASLQKIGGKKVGSHWIIPNTPAVLMSTTCNNSKILERLRCKRLPARVTLPRDIRNGNVRHVTKRVSRATPNR